MTAQRSFHCSLPHTAPARAEATLRRVPHGSYVSTVQHMPKLTTVTTIRIGLHSVVLNIQQVYSPCRGCNHDDACASSQPRLQSSAPTPSTGSYCTAAYCHHDASHATMRTHVMVTLTGLQARVRESRRLKQAHRASQRSTRKAPAVAAGCADPGNRSFAPKVGQHEVVRSKQPNSIRLPSTPLSCAVTKAASTWHHL